MDDGKTSMPTEIHSALIMDTGSMSNIDNQNVIVVGSNVTVSRKSSKENLDTLEMKTPSVVITRKSTDKPELIKSEEGGFVSFFAGAL